MVGAPDRRAPCPVDRFKKDFARLRTTNYSDIIPGARAPASTLRALAWAPLGNLVATGAANNKLRVWNPERAQVKYSTDLRGHDKSVERVVFNPLREAELASCSLDGTVRIWDVRSKANVAKFEMGKEFFSLCWTPNGEELVAGTKDDTLYRISRATNSVISTHVQPIQTNHVAFSWDGQQIFLTGGDGTVKILNYPSMEQTYTFRAHTSSCFWLDMSPTGRILAVGGTDALVTLWNTKLWTCPRTLDRLTGPIRTVSFSWCGGYITAGGEEDRGLELYHVDSGEMLHRIECGAAPLVQWSPKDYSLAYATHEMNGGLKIINGSKLGL
ncbi:WD40 repeat-like protein [Microthyrium microscopicum]|uniref:WD40 repeat-like protein n=1 Tax=Microthyrium microscopicum TaxID=703497 RepID=A0A6A6U554_9PEZI|nr:WD40 repeat-like protein [Microthyrium microscopicum]